MFRFRFDIQSNEDSNIDELFRSEKIKYRYESIIYDESTMLEIYNFCKKEIKHSQYRYKDHKVNGVPVTKSTYDLYAVYEEEDFSITTKHIYYLDIDQHGTKLREEKMFIEEDYVRPTESFEIYILVELFTTPSYTPQKTLTDILTPTFNLYNVEQRSAYEKRLYFKSKKIEYGTYTPHEIYSHTLPYLIDLQVLYKNDQIDQMYATKTTYRVRVVGNEELDLCIYYVEIDNTGSTIRESNIYDNITQNIPAPYKIKIDINIYVPTPQEELLNEFGGVIGRIQELEAEVRALSITPTRKKFIKDDTCCICLENPPTLLYPNCGHACTCNSCKAQQDLTSCPKCRTEVTVDKLQLVIE